MHLKKLKLLNLNSLVDVDVIMGLPRWLSGKGDAFLFCGVFFLKYNLDLNNSIASTS